MPERHEVIQFLVDMTRAGGVDMVGRLLEEVEDETQESIGEWFNQEGVGNGQPMRAMYPMTTGGTNDPDFDNEGWVVVLTDIPNRINLFKAIRELTSCGLLESKNRGVELLRSLPVIFEQCEGSHQADGRVDFFLSKGITAFAVQNPRRLRL